MENSLEILRDSLEMKIATLQEIEHFNQLQKKSFEEEVADVDSFDEAIERKAELIAKLEKLDEGFETLYANVAEELKHDRQKHREIIQDIQQKIQTITELSVSVQASEARNKRLIEQYFAKERRSLMNSRVGAKVAYDYYRNMSGANVAGSFFMDSKN